MTDAKDQITTITSNQQAIDEFVGEQFVAWLREYVEREAKNWSSIKFLADNAVKAEKVRKFLLQRFLSHQAFWGGAEGDIGFLRFAIANLSEVPDPAAESALTLLEKKLEASTSEQADSTQQWKKLLLALGGSDEEIEKTKPKEPTRTYIAELSDLFSSSDWQQVVGAYASYEWSSRIEQELIHQLLTQINDLPIKDLAVPKSPADFSESGHILDNAVFDSSAKQLVFEGSGRQLEITREFLSSLAKYLD